MTETGSSEEPRRSDGDTAQSPFVLASASPRRRVLLRSVGLSPRVVPADLDESIRLGETPDRYAVRVAEDKARAIQSELPVLAADTVVALDGVSLGKAGSEAEARAFLARLSGRSHHVHTGVVLVGPAGAHRALVTTEVRFRVLRRAEIERYVASGEPMDKAGGYGIQGLGGALVADVRGSYTNVVGLPLEECLQLLAKEGLW